MNSRTLQRMLDLSGDCYHKLIFIRYVSNRV